MPSAPSRPSPTPPSKPHRPSGLTATAPQARACHNQRHVDHPKGQCRVDHQPVSGPILIAAAALTSGFSRFGASHPEDEPASPASNAPGFGPGPPPKHFKLGSRSSMNPCVDSGTLTAAAACRNAAPTRPNCDEPSSLSHTPFLPRTPESSGNNSQYSTNYGDRKPIPRRQPP